MVVRFSSIEIRKVQSSFGKPVNDRAIKIMSREGDVRRKIDASQSRTARSFITCAVTGAGDTTGRSDKVPVTPRQIADASIEAANAGAAIAHIHVRDPETGKGARDVELYREVMERIRDPASTWSSISPPAWAAT